MPNVFPLKNDRIMVNVEAAGGTYNSQQLAKIAEVCASDLAIVKASENQRLCLFIKDDERESISGTLGDVGLILRDYRDGLDGPVACVGELCPHHEQEASSVALAVGERIDSLDIDVPFKISINGCGRCCVANHTSDVALVGDVSGFRLSIGGKSSAIPEFATYLAEGIPAEKVPEFVSGIISHFQSDKQVEESFHNYIERVGLVEFIKLLDPYSQDAGSEPISEVFSGSGDPSASEIPPESNDFDSVTEHEALDDIPLNGSASSDLLADSPSPMGDPEVGGDLPSQMDMDLAEHEASSGAINEGDAAGDLGELSPRDDGEVNSSELDDLNFSASDSADKWEEDSAGDEGVFDEGADASVSGNDFIGEGVSEEEGENEPLDAIDSDLSLDSELASDHDMLPQTAESLQEDASVSHQVNGEDIEEKPELKSDAMAGEKADEKQEYEGMEDDIESIETLDEDSEKDFEQKLSDSIEEDADINMVDDTEKYSEERVKLLSMLESGGHGVDQIEDASLISDGSTFSADDNNSQELGEFGSDDDEYSGLNLSRFELSNSGHVNLIFDSGAEINVDISKMKFDQEKKIFLAADSILLIKHEGGVTIEIDGVRIYHPFHSGRHAS